ncbi:hypothetical protein [Chitinophaga rhizophila]|uniref:HEPN AbiU2-like domain-containing protein n=1 Tax=Chitinophaga rhizophila TaxID=2866212 RepID=A0ABS7G763_9BACT|nr:hypothetical protein [Chitinophaga rhizophila]MBW8683497.1 hypothetical protein [Chitinophaga rhizophila]
MTKKIPYEQIEKALSASDVTACEKLYSNYFSWFTLVADLHEAACQYKNKIDALKPASFTIQYYYAESAISGSEGKLRIGKEELNKSFSEAVILHFTNTYHFDVKEYPKSAISDELIDSCRPMVEHIIHELGDNFLAVGKDQVYRKFRNNFWRIRTQPVLKGNLVKLPTYGTSVARLSTLLHALSLYITGSVVLTDECKELKEEWKIRVDTGHCYTLDQLMTIKFYANSRVDLNFQTPERAWEFFDCFDLENPPAAYIS